MRTLLLLLALCLVAWFVRTARAAMLDASRPLRRTGQRLPTEDPDFLEEDGGGPDDCSGAGASGEVDHEARRPAWACTNGRSMNGGGGMNGGPRGGGGGGVAQPVRPAVVEGGPARSGGGGGGGGGYNGVGVGRAGSGGRCRIRSMMSGMFTKGRTATNVWAMHGRLLATD